MIALWMLGAVVVAALLGAAAIAVERVARVWSRPARNVWTIAIVAALALPVAAIAWRAPHDATPVVATEGASAVPGMARLPAMVIRAGDATRDRIDRLAAELSPYDRPLAFAWLMLSLGVLTIVLRGMRTLDRARASWRVRHVDGERVLVASDVGPAVVGLTDPTIVLPEWSLALDAPLRALVLRHEREHVRAGDPRHLALGALAVTLLPWNAPLWWLGRRLRAALEIDCDARVLAARPDVTRYGLLLLAVAQRRAVPLHQLAGAPALAESTSDLSRRIAAMRMPLPRRRAARTALGAVVSSLALAGAIAACSAARDIVAPRTPTEAPQVVEGHAITVPDNVVAPTVRELPATTTTGQALYTVRRDDGTAMSVIKADSAHIARERALMARKIRDDVVESESRRAPQQAKRPMKVRPDQPYFEFQVEQPVEPAAGNRGPRYPEELRAAGVEGTVLAQFVVDTLGHVEMNTFKVLKSDNDQFTQAVKSALANMRMQPALVGGRPVKQLVQQPFQFQVTK